MDRQCPISLVRQQTVSIAVFIAENPPRVLSCQLECPCHRAPDDTESLKIQLRILADSQNFSEFRTVATCHPESNMTCQCCYLEARRFARRIQETLDPLKYSEFLGSEKETGLPEKNPDPLGNKEEFPSFRE